MPPELEELFNQSFATPTPTPTPEPSPTPEPTLVPLPPQEPSPTPRPGRDHVPGIVAFAGFNVLAVALYAGASLLFTRK
jgi:capsular polysaccharide biosynthesis protein